MRTKQVPFYVSEKYM